MGKEDDKVKLRTIDEDREGSVRVVRLNQGTTEEVEELPTVRVGGKVVPEARLEMATRGELKTRSNEPDIGSLIERDGLVEESEWLEGSASRIPWGWVVLVGCVFVAGIVWSLREVNRADGYREDLMSEAAGILEKEEMEEKNAERVIERIESTVRSYYDSRSVEELLRYVRHPRRVAPLMEKYYEDTPLKAWRVREIVSMDPLTIDYRASFWMVASRLENGEQRQLLVETRDDGEVKIDWETLVCYQPMDWDKFATARPEGYEGDFRVYAEKDHFFSHEFADSDVFASFRLTALDGEEILNGYAGLQGDLGQRISALIEANGGQPTPMILRLKVPEAVRSPRGVEITQLVRPRWLYVESPGEADP